MAEQSGFFPDVSGDREYTSSWLAEWVASFLGNGTYNGNLAVTADGSAMSVTLPAGKAWINGYYYRNDGDMTLTIDNADGTLNRKDTIVLRWDVNERSITAQVLKGTPASTATAPAIVRTVEQYDLKLAEISIPAGTTSITQSLITDTRLDTSVCGIVTGVIDQIDTTKLYQQIQADLAEFKVTNEAGFTDWFNSIKEILGEDEAANLLNMIQTHEADTTAHMTQAEKDTLNSAVQSATIGGVAVPQDGTKLKIPMPTAAEVGAVPITRTINGHALSANVTVTYSNVGAAAASHTHAASNVTAGTLAGAVAANATATATLTTKQVRNIYAGTSDMTAGSSALTTGALYFMYE